MNKELFYRYDFYALEQKYSEQVFIEILEGIPALNDAIEPFISHVAQLLYMTINDDDNIDITEIVLPNIDTELEKNFETNPLYISYSDRTEKSLSKFIFSKFLQRLFKKDGHNNEAYVIQGYIHAWLEKKLALIVVKDARFSSLKFIKSLLERTEMLHNFYSEFIENIPEEWVLNEKAEWVNVSVSAENLLDSIRTFDKDVIGNYGNSISSVSQESLWQYIQEVTRDSDYMMLNEEFSFISAVLLKNNMSLWVEFWDNLKFPAIQDCVFSSLYFSPQKYVQLIATLVNEKTVVKSNSKALLFIAAKNFFEESNKLTIRFSIYEESERSNEQNEHIFRDGREQQKKWLREKKKNYEDIIQYLKKKLSNSEIEDWVFSYKPNTNNRHFKPNDIYNSEIKLLVETYKEQGVDLLKSELQSFNLQKFNFYVEIAKDVEGKKISSRLFEAIINYISSDKFFWDRTYAEPYWSALKGLGFIISQQDKPIERANDLINKFKTVHQGWNPSKIDHSPLVKESFIYSSVALLFENESAFKNKDEKEFFFKTLLNQILLQDRYSQFDNSEYYQIPLHLLCLVANQIFPDIKEYYERELINNYDSLYSLLAILSNDKIAICVNSQALLKERLDKEFLWLKRQFSNRNQKDKVQELEKMVASFNF